MPVPTAEPKRLYVRPLPSGGYVAIEAQPVRTLFGPEKFRGQVVVERRPESRRAGHRAPIAAVAEHAALGQVLEALFAIAHSDRDIERVLASRVILTAIAGRSRRV